MRKQSLDAFRWCSAGIMIGLAITSVASAHEGPVWDDAREIQSLAVNVDKAIQACGLHVSDNDPQRRAEQAELTSRGLRFQSEAPPGFERLITILREARYHHWFDPHAEIWLLASTQQPVCRIVVSKSQWVTRIGPELSRLIQVGNFWRPARDEENPFAQDSNENAPTNSVYIMETPDHVPVRPILIVTAPAAGKMLTAGQQLIITVGRLKK